MSAVIYGSVANRRKDQCQAFWRRTSRPKGGFTLQRAPRFFFFLRDLDAADWNKLLAQRWAAWIKTIHLYEQPKKSACQSWPASSLLGSPLLLLLLLLLLLFPEASSPRVIKSNKEMRDIDGGEKLHHAAMLKHTAVALYWKLTQNGYSTLPQKQHCACAFRSEF